MRTAGGGGQKSENFANVIYEWPLIIIFVTFTYGFSISSLCKCVEDLFWGITTEALIEWEEVLEERGVLNVSS